MPRLVLLIVALFGAYLTWDGVHALWVNRDMVQMDDAAHFYVVTQIGLGVLMLGAGLGVIGVLDAVADLGERLGRHDAD